MTVRPWALALFLAAASVSSPASGQSSLAKAQVAIADGIELELSMTGVTSGTRVLQPSARVHDGDLYRLIVDGDGYARFAYAVRVEPRPSGIELMFRPVRLHEALHAFKPRQSTYESPFKLDSGLRTLPDVQWSGAMRVGDRATLDLFQQPGSDQRIGDQIAIVSVTPTGLSRLRMWRAQRQDTRPVLTVAGMTIRRNGRVLHRDQPGDFATGHAIGIGLGDGAATVLLSAEPPGDHVPYGVAIIDGRTLTFALDGAEYECTTTDPIGPEGLTSVWMYVRREPMPYVKGYFVAAGDSVAPLLAAGGPKARE